MTARHDSVLLHFFVRWFLVPFILLFALYVLVHGELSPGGGFQGGAIFAAGLILARLSLGADGERGLFTRDVLVTLAAAGLGIFAFTGVAAMAFGADYLDYGAVPFEWIDKVWPGELSRRQIGIFIIEGGIATAVFATLMLLFDYLTERDPGAHDPEVNEGGA
jgi:multicomponent Na+:H+ antiporter subunit B